MAIMDAATLEEEGWSRLPTSAFSAAIGPTFMTGDPGKRVIGLIGDPVQANENIGVVHGGVLLTFADIAMGCAVADVLGGAHCATAQLQYQFAGAARIDDFITCEPEVVRKTSQLVFVRGLVKANGRVIGSVDAIFKVLDEGKMAGMKTG